MCPALSADGSTVYFLSERNGGSMNVYSMPLANPAALTKISDFSTHPVRFLSVADNGTMCYTYDGAIYTQLNGEKPALVDIDIVRDDVDLPSSLSFTNGATSASVSPDGKQVAFTVRGNVFVTSVEYGTTKANCVRKHFEQGISNFILIDDNKSVRDGWHLGETIEPHEDLPTALWRLVEEYTSQS